MARQLKFNEIKKGMMFVDYKNQHYCLVKKVIRNFCGVKYAKLKIFWFSGSSTPYKVYQDEWEHEMRFDWFIEQKSKSKARKKYRN